MFRPLALGAPLLLLTATLACAQVPVPTPAPVLNPAAPLAIAANRGLTLEECVSRALGKNFDLEIQRFATISARDDVIAADATYDPALAVSTSRGAAETDNTGIRRDGESTVFSVSQRLVTGASVTASSALDRNKVTPTSGLTNPAYDSDVALSIRQPLLKGAGPAVNRAAINRARLGVTRANYDFKSVVLSVVRDVESAYYSLAFAREQLAVRNFSLEVSQKLLSENTARRDQGVATDLDVLQAEVGVANARRDVLLADQAVRDRQDLLLRLIGRFEFNTPLGDIRLGEDPVLTVSLDHSYALARDNQPDYASTRLSIQQLELDTRVARSNRLPALDVGAAVGYNARDETSYGSASREVWGSDGYNWQVDLSLSVPWGLRAENARYRQSLTSLSREQTRLLQLEQDILVNVRQAVRAVETNQESLRISTLATQLSDRQFAFEKARYDAGLSTFRRVQESQEDLDNARVNELQARVNLRIALSELARLEGSSLPRYNIVLAE